MQEDFTVSRDEMMYLLKKARRDIRMAGKPRNPASLRRRARALRFVVALWRNDCHHIAVMALRRLGLGDLELLISAFGAEREHRPLSEDETLARRHYMTVRN